MNAIEIHSLRKEFKELVAVNDLTLSIEEGSLFALLGVNGAGKTTTIKMLTGVIQPTAGDATLLGHSICTDLEQVKSITNVSPQETAVAPNLTERENLELMAGIYGEKNPKAKAEEIIGSLKLQKHADRLAKKLSGGWQRRLSIALALISDPKILFLDEPTLGLDVLARRELWELIRTLHGKTTVVLTTHYLEEAEALADRIAVMADGNLVAIGTAEELKAQTNTRNFEEAFVSLVTKGGRAE